MTGVSRFEKALRLLQNTNAFPQTAMQEGFLVKMALDDFENLCELLAGYMWIESK